MDIVTNPNINLYRWMYTIAYYSCWCDGAKLSKPQRISLETAVNMRDETFRRRADDIQIEFENSLWRFCYATTRVRRPVS